MAWTNGNGYRCGHTQWRHLRAEAFARDNHTCRACGLHSPDNIGLETDHIIEYAHGGLDHLGNLQTLCRDCHKTKTNAESAARNRARAARRRRPTEPHPGLRPPPAAQ